ncbi:chromo domain-containing protein [Colletotrichum truncatum]|uniref:Chromo domain-containing protein n=1 Tax=Colletotrichum truncatum TaxID=5467 RepID=A0ACC3YSZ3_COLTU|nr:chromo domain-containing protein [Colletotrichum truncatum]KAF6785113.1 chromo domain-containing protein [Colletotrichum truncatum]
MSVPKVFKGREIEMTQDQFASEKASFAVTQDEDEEDIPFIKSDITSSGGVRSFDTSEGKRKRGRPSKNSCLGAKRLKQPIFYTHVEAPEDPNPSDMEPVKDESSTEDGALRSSPETFAQKNRKNGKMQKSTQAVVLSLETAPVASMGPDIPQSRDFRSSPETKENNDSSSEDENDLSVLC